jgi:hypothetical protein
MDQADDTFDVVEIFCSFTQVNWLCYSLRIKTAAPTVCTKHTRNIFRQCTNNTNRTSNGSLWNNTEILQYLHNDSNLFSFCVCEFIQTHFSIYDRGTNVTSLQNNGE